MSKVKITRSSMEDLERPDCCELKWKERWIEKSIPFPINEDMYLGLYFEQLCIGRSAYDGSEVKEEDLPKGRGGKESVKVERVKEQAKLFEELFNPLSDKFLGFSVSDTQKVSTYSTEDHEETIISDIEAYDERTGERVIIDLKFTKDADSTFHPKSWGFNEDCDFTQAEFYLDTKEKLKEDFACFVYLIFDVTPATKVKMIEVRLDEESRISINNRKQNFLKLAKTITESTDEMMILRPSEKECSNCNKTECLFRHLK